jgi:DNA-binding CsgD family transcriptional regulator
VADAEASLTECLRLIRQSGSTDLYSVARCVEVCAWMEAGRHRYQRAATLLGAVDAFRALSGTPVSVFGHLVDHHRACERDARAGLGDGAFTAALARGQAMSYEEAIRYVLDEPGAPSPAGRPATLTRREDEVAGLIAQGLSNKEIAAALVISQRTAESHVEHILAKLGFSSRSQVAAWSARR